MKNQQEFYQIYDAYPYLKNPKKFIGQRPITLRSSYEISFVFKFLDIHPSILQWKNEDVVVLYEGLDGKIHRYFIDFWMKCKTKDNNIKEYLIEIKPSFQTIPPKKKGKNYEKRLKEYLTNLNKWQAAKEFAEQNNMQFLILTEKELFS